jgi:flagellar hook-associated protein 3 FlgL
MIAVSSTTFYTSLREPILRLQSQIGRIQKDISGGVKADLGLDIGSGAATDLSLRNGLATCQSWIGAMKTRGAQVTAMQTALTAISSAGQALQQQLSETSASIFDANALRASAAGTIAQVQSLLNTQVQGAFLFGGINSSVAPAVAYTATPASAAKVAVEQAFRSEFGFSHDDPRVASISGDAMQTFVDTKLSGLFSDAAWKSDWSKASDSAVDSRLPSGGAIRTSVTANEPGIRKLIEAAVVISDLGLQSLSKDAQKVLVGTATSLINDGIGGIDEAQARMGVAQNQIDSSASYLSTQTTYLQNRIDEFEQVDPAAASLQLTSLSTQLQGAYALTSRISQLSLLKYI